MLTQFGDTSYQEYKITDEIDETVELYYEKTDFNIAFGMMENDFNIDS